MSRTHRKCEFELEGGPFEEGTAAVVTASDEAVRTCLLDVYAVDDFEVTSYFSN